MMCLMAAYAFAGDLAPHGHPDPGSSEAGLWMMADTIEAGLKMSPLRVREGGLDAYVRGVLCRLAPARCDDFRIYILDIPHFNAMVLPNGAVQVWTGLLLRVRNEAQLGFVLGHEMTHYTRRHALNGWWRQRQTAGALRLLKVSVTGADAMAGNRFARFLDMADIVALAATMSYARSDEDEADAGGFDLMNAAGYDVGQSVAVWKNRLAEEAVHPSHSFDALADTHPPTVERLAAMQKRASGLGGGATNAVAYSNAVKPFRLAWMKADLDQGEYARSLILLGAMLADEPNDGALLFCRAEAYRRRAGDGDGALAIADYRAALATPEAPPEAWRGLGLSLRRAGETAGAHAAFETYLAQMPNSPDRAMIRSYLAEP